MPPPEKQNENKTSPSMNIKTAFLAAANRKRKASSPILPKKSLKVDDDVKINKGANADDDDIEIISCSNDITVGECKENTDLNSLSTQKTSPLKSVQEKPVKSQSGSNSDVSESDSSSESSDELNSSNLNNSLNATLSNDQCENDAQNEMETSPNSKKNQLNEKGTPKGSSDLCQKDAPVRKKRKMTADEAKKKSEEREKIRKESLAKKQTLNAEKLKRRLEKEQRKIQKQVEKEKKEAEKKERERLRQEKKEQEEKEKQQKLKEREDQKKMKQLQLELKLLEKKKKEEQRLKREEEIKKAEEEKQRAKLEKEQKEKEKLEKNKAAFMKFFVAPKQSSTPAAPQVVKQELAFKPFQVSEDMTLAPVVPVVAKQRFNKEKLDDEFKLQECVDLYIQILKSGTYKDIRMRKKLKKPRTCDDVIVIDNSDPGLHLKAKLLQFSENVRPPYWGTWRKKSSNVRPRNPFGEDEIFDYSVDSDDEWDEGGPGESLSGTENEVESEDDYEVDNEFFVPHGYLSDEEEMDDEVDDGVETDPKKKEAKLTLKQQEFEMERKKKTTELKPLILGCYFENSEESADSGLRTLLQIYSGETMCETPILTRFTIKKYESESKSQSSANTPANNSSNKAKVFPEEAMPHLIRLVHGNTNKRDRLCNEFQAFWQLHGAPSNEIISETPKSEEGKDPNSESPTSLSKSITKRQFSRLLKTIATYGKIANPAVKKCCWYVQDEVRAKYGLEDAPIPNQWTYVSAAEKETEATASPVVSKSNCGSIKGFLKP